MLKARIYRSGKREFDCKILNTGEMVKAQALGNLLKGSASLVVGDFVTLVEEGTGYTITERDDRTSEVSRIIIRENKKKAVAANCDLMIILMSVSSPKFKRGIIDRFLIRASQWGIRPIVILNKMDEYSEDDFDIIFERDRLKMLGAQCFEISAIDKNYQKRYLDDGIEELRSLLKDRTAIFLGQSGVGKSKTINLLSEGDVELKTNKVGKANKGSHTTTWAEIIDCNFFSLIDSPGVRTFSLQDLLSENFIEYFPDLEEIATRCKFNNCSHEENVKGCAFHSIEDEYEKALVFSRLESYWRILEELENVPDWKKR